MAAVASGKAEGARLIGPSSRITRLTMPRAGRPVTRLVMTVCRAASLCSAARCAGVVMLVGAQVGGAHLHALGAQGARGAHAGRAGDAAGGDDGHTNGGDHSGQQPKVPICSVRSSLRKCPPRSPASRGALPPIRGAVLPRGGPSGKKCPPRSPLRALPPEWGLVFASGRPVGKKCPRCPPASSPWAMMASAPCPQAIAPRARWWPTTARKRPRT